MINSTFATYTEKLPVYMNRLLQMPLQLLEQPSVALPTAGIYVFYEGNTALYVGRTGRLKKRLKEHGAPSSSHYSASFAFLLAREEALANSIDCLRKRKELQVCPLFSPHFVSSKAKVAAMTFRCVEIEHPIEQTLFEVYAAVELKARYNSFEPH